MVSTLCFNRPKQIEMTQTTQIVGVQDHSQRVVVLRPSWVMIEALRKKCHVRHETEARAKIFKSITTLDLLWAIEAERVHYTNFMTLG